jgi:hypothetical protein
MSIEVTAHIEGDRLVAIISIPRVPLFNRSHFKEGEYPQIKRVGKVEIVGVKQRNTPWPPEETRSGWRLQSEFALCPLESPEATPAFLFEPDFQAELSYEHFFILLSNDDSYAYVAIEHGSLIVRHVLGKLAELTVLDLKKMHRAAKRAVKKFEL